MPEYRPYKHYADAELYSLVLRFEEELELSPSSSRLHKQLALVEDEIEYREWD